MVEPLAKQGQGEVAIQMLRARADDGEEYAAVRMAELLAEQGQVEQLRALADDGNDYAARRLASP